MAKNTYTIEASTILYFHLNKITSKYVKTDRGYTNL